jgi:hypothetical protein
MALQTHVECIAKKSRVVPQDIIDIECRLLFTSAFVGHFHRQNEQFNKERVTFSFETEIYYRVIQEYPEYYHVLGLCMCVYSSRFYNRSVGDKSMEIVVKRIDRIETCYKTAFLFFINISIMKSRGIRQ